MDSIDPIALLSSLAMGVTLAACAGLRAFLPPLALGLSIRAGLLDAPPGLEWLGSTGVLATLMTAVVVELIGDKVPVVDHLLDVAGTVLRPAAGALVGAVPLVATVAGSQDLGHASAAAWSAGITGGLIGSLVSAGVHLLKTQLRIGSSLITAGVLSPVISLFEDTVGVMGVLLALLVPVLALGMLLTATLGLFLVLRRRRRVAPRGV